MSDALALEDTFDPAKFVTAMAVVVTLFGTLFAALACLIFEFGEAEGEPRASV